MIWACQHGLVEVARQLLGAMPVGATLSALAETDPTMCTALSSVIAAYQRSKDSTSGEPGEERDGAAMQELCDLIEKVVEKIDPALIDHHCTKQDLCLGITPLSAAATLSLGSVVEALLKRGAEPMVTDHVGRTALYNAAQSGSSIAVVSLLSALGLECSARGQRRFKRFQRARQAQVIRYIYILLSYYHEHLLNVNNIH